MEDMGRQEKEHNGVSGVETEVGGDEWRQKRQEKGETEKEVWDHCSCVPVARLPESNWLKYPRSNGDKVNWSQSHTHTLLCEG